MESDCQFSVAPHLYAAAADDGQFLHQQQLSGGDTAAAGRPGERKRRFTEEQVRSLETTFHSRRAAKMEPREKAELARELGLQPRQVAIWFQNKRARTRAKQLEQDFAELRAHYDALHARVESIKQEKLALAAQVEMLRGKLNEQQDHSSSCDGADDKRSNVNCITEEEAPAVVDISDGSAAAWYDDLAYGGDLTEPFRATPELWETWPLLEWNAVA